MAEFLCNQKIYEFYQNQSLFSNRVCPVCKKKFNILRFYTSVDNIQEMWYYCQTDKIKFSDRHGTIFYKMKISFSDI